MVAAAAALPPTGTSSYSISVIHYRLPLLRTTTSAMEGDWKRFKILFLGDPAKQKWGWDGKGVESDHPTATKGMAVPPDKGDASLPLQINGRGQSIWQVAARFNQPDFISRLHYLRSNPDVPSGHAVALERSLTKVDLNNQVKLVDQDHQSQTDRNRTGHFFGG